MEIDGFWKLVEEARRGASEGGAEGVAEATVALLARRSGAEIVGAAQPFWDLMAVSYRGELWGAAYLINGGASDDGFDYFRGWLISQGREVFERAVADPDSLAEVPAVRAAAAAGEDLEGEDMLGVAWNAHRIRTGRRLPEGAFTIRYPAIEFGWDFDDDDAIRRRLPRLSRLFLD